MTPAAAAPHLRIVAPKQAPALRPGALAFAPRQNLRRDLGGRKPLGQILIDMKAVDPGNMLKALALRARQNVRIGDILVTRGWVSQADLMAALSVQWGAKTVDVLAQPPDARLLDRLGAEFCLRHGVLPWRQIGGAVVIASARPESFDAMRAALPPAFGPVLMALAPEPDIHAALINMRQSALIRKAETRVAAEESCRSQTGERQTLWAFGGLAVLGGGLVL
ncbi:MAG: glycosyl transferase, partial [Albidovulum sp.]